MIRLKIPSSSYRKEKLTVEKKILSAFLMVLVIIFFTTCISPLSLAMSKRPKDAKENDAPDFVLPEIEIITKPEAERDLLSRERPKSPQRVPVTPSEVIPAVGQDVSQTLKNYHTSDVQKALRNAGYDPGAVDGKKGPKTKQAIQDFQEDNNLTVDGVVGKKTWTKLKPYLNKSNSTNAN